MDTQFSRTELIIGNKGLDILAKSRVAVFGIGGVGGYCVEALARAGVGCIDIIDSDKVAESNINRQIYALHSTLGKYKVDVAKERILDINPDIQVNAYNIFYLPSTAEMFDFHSYDYIIDAIDTVSGKFALIENAKKADTPIICAMGAGNKLHPEMFEVADISKTSVCPLARVLRTGLKNRGIKDVKVVYSKEIPQKSELKDSETGKSIPGSISFVPSVVGLIMAGEVIKDLILCNNA